MYWVSKSFVLGWDSGVVTFDKRCHVRHAVVTYFYIVPVNILWSLLDRAREVFVHEARKLLSYLGFHAFAKMRVEPNKFSSLLVCRYCVVRCISSLWWCDKFVSNLLRFRAF